MVDTCGGARTVGPMFETTTHTVCVTTHELLALQAICAEVVGLDHDDDLIRAVDGGGFDVPSQRTWVISDLARSTLAAWADGPLRTDGWMDLVAFELAGTDDDAALDVVLDELEAATDGIAQLARSAAAGGTLYVI